MKNAASEYMRPFELPAQRFSEPILRICRVPPRCSARQPRAHPPELNVEEKPTDAPMPDDAPTEPVPALGDATPHDEPKLREYQVDDTYNFHEEIDAEIGDRLEVDWEGEELHDGDGDHMMATLVNVLQTAGVAVGDAAEYAVQIVKNRNVSPTTIGQPYTPTFFEA